MPLLAGRPRFSEEYTLHDLREMAPRVPFARAREESGFDLPEIRMTPAARQWLESHPAPWLLLNDPPAASALEGVRLQLDRPVDNAVAGWSAPRRVLTPLRTGGEVKAGRRPGGLIS